MLGRDGSGMEPVLENGTLQRMWCQHEKLVRGLAHVCSECTPHIVLPVCSTVLARLVASVGLSRAAEQRQQQQLVLRKVKGMRMISRTSWAVTWMWMRVGRVEHPPLSHAPRSAAGQQQQQHLPGRRQVAAESGWQHQPEMRMKRGRKWGSSSPSVMAGEAGGVQWLTRMRMWWLMMMMWARSRGESPRLQQHKARAVRAASQAGRGCLPAQQQEGGVGGGRLLHSRRRSKRRMPLG
jgi:hypothetical protein